MTRQSKSSSPKKRKPVILLVCEGRNKSERLYFEHFNNRNNSYGLKIKDCESTDIMSMAKKTNDLYKYYQLDKELGDHAFCLIDLDLDNAKKDKYEKAKTKYKNIEFIVSNPCFEVWLLYYFTPNPKVENSSQKVKAQMQKYLHEYTEATDVIAIKHLEDSYSDAISRSKKKNSLYVNRELIDKNPYTEIQNIITVLTEKE